MEKLLWFAFSIFALPHLCDGAKILVVFPFPGKSHNILGEGFVRILLEAGHEVTYMTPYPKTNAPPNLSYVNISSDLEFTLDNGSPLKSVGATQMSFSDIKSFFSLIVTQTKNIYTNENVQKMLNDPKQHFDLIIFEWMFSEATVGLAAVFDCPFIWFSSVDPHWMVLQLIDKKLNPAYNPDILSTNTTPFTFWQRTAELLFQFIIPVMKNIYQYPYEREIYIEELGPILAKKGRQLPPYEEIIYNASLMLGNSHVSIGKSIRLPQNYKAIGGYHIDPVLKPLPEDLKKIMEYAKHPVIYFNMGSFLKSKDLPDEIKNRLLKMFGRLKYTVLWKFEEQLKNLPKNVHILEWAPQTSILAHPNCKVFITHGGLLSTLETIHFKVPTIGIPIMADQILNVANSVNKGFALKVDLSYEMADELKAAIEEILENPKYQKKVDELNLIYYDRPVPPSTEVNHWVNHVIRTKGAPHLRSPALMLPWYQKMYLDLLAVVFIIIYVLVKILKLLCCSRKSQMSDKKKKN